MDNKRHRKGIKIKEKKTTFSANKRNAFNETAQKAYKSLFEVIKLKSKNKPPLTKDTATKTRYQEKIEYYERNNW